MVRGKRRSRRGQSIIEYLVIVAAVIAAIIAFRGSVQGGVNNLQTQAVNRMDAAAEAMNNNIGAARQ